jgi:transcriptional regulator with XRE-family HTH domain
MDGGWLLRFGVVQKKGPLHERLQATLRQAWVSKAITQESLAKATGQSQENIGQYLRGGKAGALNVDQADAALRHIGSSLAEFLANVPPRDLSDVERLARDLAGRKELQPWVEGLLSVPGLKLPAVLELINVGVRAATGKAIAGSTGSPGAPKKGRRTTAGSRSRPRALKQR